MTTYKDIIYAVADHVATITINRPEVLNAFTPVTLTEIQEALAQAASAKDVAVVVITGTGQRAFCSGGDVNWESSDEFSDHEYELHHHILRCPKPVIARVNGYAIGGGNHMAYFCDLTVAADHAVFGQNGPHVGSPAAGFTVAHAANIIGHKRAREMWLTCRRYTAAEMLTWGLVNAVAPYAELDATVRIYVDDILKLSPSCIKLLKETFRLHAAPVAQLRQDDLVAKILPGYFQTGEQQEGAKAFLEKRSPDFTKWR